MNKTLLCAALAGLATISIAGAAQAEMPAGKVKCYGIAMAGKNACASADGSHSCAGQAKIDSSPNEWVYAASAEECATKGGSAGAPKR